MCPDDVRVELEEFRANAAQYVGYAQVGSTVVVQSNGVAIAHVVPPPARQGRYPLGALAGKILIGANFDDDLPPEMMRAITDSPV